MEKIIDFLGEESESKQKRQTLSFKIIWQNVRGVLRFSLGRLVTVVISVGVGLYLTLLVINLGGFVDDIQQAQIDETVGMLGRSDYFDGMTIEERDAIIADMRWQMAEAMGLHEPLPIRTARWWVNGVTLQWGSAERMAAPSKNSNLVKDIILEKLPYTLLLAGSANIALFFINLWVAMALARHQGKFWDRLISWLTPISSIPSWVHGIILITIFALELRILPFEGLFDTVPPEDKFEYAWQILKHMILPGAAIFFSLFFQGVYSWRTFFLVHSGEDYVDLAIAKGLPERIVRRRYLLRPTLPSVITNFTMMLLSFWEGAIALELLFNWPGLGALFYSAIRLFDRPVVVGIVVMFAYLMGISVIILDIVYALIDPRVRVESQGASVRRKSLGQRFGFKALFNLFKRKTSLPQPETFRPPVNAPEFVRGAEDRGAQKQRKPLFQTWKAVFQPVRKNFKKYPLAIVGLAIIVILSLVSIVTVILVPYDEAVAYWPSEGWLETPRLARPAWTNFFRREKWPESIYFNSTRETEGVAFTEDWVTKSDTMTEINQVFEFEFTADEFPQDLMINFQTTYDAKAPYSQMLLVTPDGRQIALEDIRATDDYGFVLSYQDFGRYDPNVPTAVEYAFGDPATEFTEPLKGKYQLQVISLTFEPDSDVEIQAVMHGKVYGLFGTDDQRRDLTIAILWGAPVALVFGFAGAAVTTLTILLAATSAWFGGVIDRLLEMLTEINFTLPMLAIAILVSVLYSKSIWVIMTIVVVNNVFGSTLREYRAMFLQLKEASYIEAAKVYGASDFRIISKYMLPRIIQVLIPQLVISVPGYVFLEATLAYLGVETPYLPTWGKVILNALERGAFAGHYFWVLEPIVMALITGLAFAFVGFALDEILNPRLRDQ